MLITAIDIQIIFIQRQQTLLNDLTFTNVMGQFMFIRNTMILANINFNL